MIARPAADIDQLTLETVNALVDQGWRVLVALPTAGPFADEARRAGADVRVLGTSADRPGRGPRHPLSRLVDGLHMWLRAGALIAAERPAIIYVSTLGMAAWVLRARLAQVPVLVHVREPNVLDSARIERAVSSMFADLVLVRSAAERDALADTMSDLRARTRVVPDALDGPSSTSHARTALEGGLRALCIGPLSHASGVDEAVGAIAILAKRGVDARLDILGSIHPGEEHYPEQLRRHAASARVADRVRVRIDRDAWRAVTASDVVVVPGHLDVLTSDPALMAVLAARPVVVTTAHGATDSLEGVASAVVIDSSDAASVARALERIAANWTAFARVAAAVAPITAERHSPATYRAGIAAAVAHLAPLDHAHHVLTS